jgi:hypothetical protein
MNVVPLVRRMLLGLGLGLLGVLSFTPTALASSAAPSLSFTPSSWTAGPIASGTTTSQTFTLTNTGGMASGTITVTLSGSAAFTTIADTCTGRSLGPDKSCSVTVQYAPTSNGESDTATLSANGEHASASAPLTGSSTNPNPFAKSQADCEALGGTFSTDPSTDQFGFGTRFLWSCNNQTTASGLGGTLANDCLADNGGQGEGFETSAIPPFDSSCAKPL